MTGRAADLLGGVVQRVLHRCTVPLVDLDGLLVDSPLKRRRQSAEQEGGAWSRSQTGSGGKYCSSCIDHEQIFPVNELNGDHFLKWLVTFLSSV